MMKRFSASKMRLTQQNSEKQRKKKTQNQIERSEQGAIDIGRYGRGNQPDPTVPLITPSFVSVEPT